VNEVGTRLSGPDGPPGIPGGARQTPDDPQRYHAVLDNLGEVVFQTDAAGNWTYLNAAWTAITGFGVAETLGTRFLDYVHPDERDATVAMFVAVVSGGADHCHHATRYVTADGGQVWLELRSSVLFDDRGAVVGNAGTIIDITERRRAEEQLAEQARVLELIACDKPLEEVLGALAVLAASHLRARVGVSVLPGDSDPQRRGVAHAELEGVLAVGRPDGLLESTPPTLPAGRATSAPAELGSGGSAALKLDVPIAASGGQRLGTVALFGPAAQVDEAGRLLLERCAQLAAIAVERRHASARARHAALHDPLTGLPNRTLYADRLTQALAGARRHRGSVALLMIDLDHFKMVNDTLGHEAGDEVLRRVADRLRAALRRSDTVCRLGGDEFVVVLPDVERLHDAQRMASKLWRTLREPVSIGDVQLSLEFSMGLAVSSPVDDDPAALLRRADVAMYRAKRDRGGPALYDARFDEGRLRGLNLAGELRQAIEDDQLLLHYQPKVDLREGRVVGVEALVRWRHPALGMVAPDLFVPLAETTAVIKPLSLWVLETALRDRAEWSRQGFDVAVAVNLSARVLHDADLPGLVGHALERAGVDGAQLELEITESALMADPERSILAMDRLITAGVTISIDDFGTGYSSLAYLKRLPAASLKIDKSFVAHMDTDDRDASIVRSAIDLAHDLGMGVVAEGVESADVHGMLATLACDYAQGFHVAHPMPAAALPDWLRGRVEAGR